MPLKLLYLIFLSQIYLNGLFSQQSNASQIFIISNENLEGNYYYLDEINIGHPVNVTKIKSLIIKTSEPILLFEATQKQTPYLLFPGDSLQLMPASHGLSFLKLIHPKDSIKRNQIDFFRQVVNNVGTVRIISLNIPPIYSSYNMAQRDSAININYQRRLNYLEEYSASNFLNNEFKHFCLVLFKSYQIKEKFYINNENFSEIISYYKNELNDFFSFFSNDSNITNPAFRDAAWTFFNTLTKQNSQREKYDFVKNNFIGKTKDFLLTRVAIDWFNKDLKSFNEITLKQQSDCNDSIYRKIALQYFDKTKKDMTFTFKSTQFIKSCLVNNALDTLSWKDLIAANQGNLIYIDFWASWCTPCRREMPYSELLRKKLKDENVVFVYVSIDKKKSDWEIASDDIGIGKYSKSYIVLNPEKDEFIQKLKVEQIPRYVLLDKSGKMLMRDSYRPSDSLLLEKISKALKK